MTDLAQPEQSPRLDIAMIGFGEAAEAFIEGWGIDGDRRVRAFDVKTDDPDQRTAMLARMAEAGVEGETSLAQALEGRSLVFSLVTADQALAAASSAVLYLPKGALWLDGNSCSPDTKRAAAEAIERAHGRYVDVAVMAPVRPKLHRTPLLVSGPHAEAALAALEPLGMIASHAGEAVGQASSIKMLRSVMVKGIEALSAECVLAARRAGVEEAVLESLNASDPAIDWRARSAYNLERMMVHGVRRAAELREVALTLRQLGLPDRMASAIAAWQEQIGTLGLESGADDLTDRADRLLAELDP